jgi:hypothetical protein
LDHDIDGEKRMEREGGRKEDEYFDRVGDGEEREVQTHSKEHCLQG